jgi:glycosyltransferase involved in cell wall biosynthesis
VSSVSVIIPVRNCELYLGEAIRSVVEGTVKPAEVLVIDDGSTDGSVSVASGFGAPVICLQREPDGLAAACNRGIEASRGDLVAFVDADDRWTARKLETQTAILAEDPSIGAAFAHASEFVSPELTEAQRAEVRIHEGAVPARVRGTMLARRELFDLVGPFDETISVGDFVDWHARADEAEVRTVLTDDVLLERRVHLTNMGRSAPDSRLEYVRVVRMALHRRGGADR